MYKEFYIKNYNETRSVEVIHGFIGMKQMYTDGFGSYKFIHNQTQLFIVFQMENMLYFPVVHHSISISCIM